jgi:hypothetical protein
MARTRPNLIVESSLFLLLMLLVVLGGKVYSDLLDVNAELKKENGVLKAEIVEWQKAAMPAITAREWSHLQIKELSPLILERALDPCLAYPDSFRRTELDCYARHNIPGSENSKPPIKIDFAYSKQ